jgi:hypothetical protein
MSLGRLDGLPAAADSVRALDQQVLLGEVEFPLPGVELANLAGDALNDVITAAERGIARIRATHHLNLSFLRTSACPIVTSDHVAGRSETSLNKPVESQEGCPEECQGNRRALGTA